MEISRRDMTEYARSLGIDDIRFASTDGIKTLAGTAIELRSSNDINCIIVLFKAYLPAKSAQAGHMGLSSYYVASNAAYHAAKDLASYINSQGAQAVHTALISAREAALKTGGFIADNGFYYHEQYGSYVCIQTILTDAIQADIRQQSTGNACLHCGACAAACPAGAVHDLRNCLRKHSNGLIPAHLRGDLYQLFGCEKCQSACPLNTRDKSTPHAFCLDELLKGQHTAELKALAGSNQARARRILSQAVLYAANTRAAHLLPKIETLSQTADEPVRTHALWAYHKLKEGGQ